MGKHDTKKHVFIPSWDTLKVYLFIEKKLDRSREKKLIYNYNYIAQYFSDKEFTKENINNFFIEIQKEKHIKNSTCNYYLKLLKHIAHYKNETFLDDWRYFTEDPIYVDPLTPAEIRKLVECIVPYKKNSELINYRYKCIILTLALTGMRIQELCDLRYADLIENRFILRDTKTNTVRQIPLAPIILESIKELKKYNEYIFGSSQGKLKPQTVNSELKKRADIVKLNKRVYCHLFRHSFITQAIKDGHSIVKIARIVGHSDIATTDGYTHLIVDDLFEVVYSHPLVKERLTFDEIQAQIKKYICKLIDESYYQLNITTTDKSLSIGIKTI